MVLSTHIFQENSQNSIFQLIIRQLPTLRYGLYVIIPLVLMKEIANYVDHINPVTNEEKMFSLGIIITSLTTLVYLTLKKIFYNINEYWTLGGSTVGSLLLTVGGNLYTIPFNIIGLLVGLSIAVNLSHEIARFDSMQYQREKKRRKEYNQYPNFELHFKIARNGLLRVKLFGYAIIPIRNISFSQKQTLSGFLKTKEVDFIERERDVIINYNEKIEGWIFRYFRIKKKLLDSYVIFLTGINDVMK
ncbi:MAG: hypothetical protein HeimC3_13990 [Candidatus Heimdallarchaeota archaeon LC_3]|nr:MAG: hypothetical protein HeimC3_13990 [Candidatus Heimdallarchaeota archaeon LC_3]